MLLAGLDGVNSVNKHVSCCCIVSHTNKNMTVMDAVRWDGDLQPVTQLECLPPDISTVRRESQKRVRKTNKQINKRTTNGGVLTRAPWRVFSWSSTRWLRLWSHLAWSPTPPTAPQEACPDSLWMGCFWSVCMCVCMRLCVCAWVCVSVCVCVSMYVCTWVFVCVQTAQGDTKWDITGHWLTG